MALVELGGGGSEFEFEFESELDSQLLRSHGERLLSVPAAFLCQRYFERSDARTTIKAAQCCQALGLGSHAHGSADIDECDLDLHLPSHVVLYRATLEHADVQGFFQEHYEKVGWGGKARQGKARQGKEILGLD